MSVRTAGGLHYVDGLPAWFEYAFRGLTFLLAVACAGMLMGMLSQRRTIHRGLWWVGVACLIASGRIVLTQIERWDVAMTLEGMLSLPLVVALAWGMALRLRDGTIGR